MKKIRPLLLLLMAFVGLVMVRCNKSNDIKPDSKANVNRSARMDGTCGTETTCPLWAGQTINAGTLAIENDNTNLYVTYTTTGIFDMLHLWVGTNFELMPQTNNGTPIPGQFPYKYDVEGGNTHVFTIPLKDIPFYDMKCGVNTKTPILVVAHAEVNVLGGGKETAFGGCVPVNVKEAGRWYYYASHSVQCCDGTTPPPPTEKLGTAFGYGTHVFTTDPKSNPTNPKLPSLNLTKNRWGWALNLTQPTTTPVTNNLWVGAGLNNTSKALKVGTVTVSWTGSIATVTYSLLPGYAIEEAHIYANDMKPSTIAPGQYGSTTYFNPFANTFTKSFDVSDSNNDGIWIIAHAVAYGTSVVNVQ
jgi:hypothetical protein